MRTPGDWIARFNSKVEPVPWSGCWIWTGGLFSTGYGQFNRANGRSGGQPLQAHRVSYELHIGPIPDGLVIDHMCRQKMCVNPAHLRAVTTRVNAIENSDSWSAVNARKTHCMRGHEFTSENTLPVRGGRACRECKRADFRRWYRNKRRKK